MKHQLKAVVPHSVQWGSQADAVFAALAGDFMVDVVHVVDELLAAGERNKGEMMNWGTQGFGRFQRGGTCHMLVVRMAPCLL